MVWSEFLTHLRLSNTYLSDNISPEIGNCKTLRTLLLEYNLLQGKIPVELGQITELSVLDVSRNNITDMDLGSDEKQAPLIVFEEDSMRLISVFLLNCFVGIKNQSSWLVTCSME
ncbi:hypothetical protein V6N13_029932 [Hibiscus sabdariffa]|uniref:Uncharacterized protein n=1 Tax=Hibiscus sabdariffa TaxID=183260 RepID=A0ABR2T949_9ROSI